MGYLVEIDDLRKQIIYPPRGMEFESVETSDASVLPAPEAKFISQEQKPSQQQTELLFSLEPTNEVKSRTILL